VVYRARHRTLGHEVALKMILAGGHASEEERARFLLEAAAVARLRHPGIVHIHEFGEHGGSPYFSLELLPGGSLAERLKTGRLPSGRWGPSSTSASPLRCRSAARRPTRRCTSSGHRSRRRRGGWRRGCRATWKRSACAAWKRTPASATSPPGTWPTTWPASCA